MTDSGTGIGDQDTVFIETLGRRLVLFMNTNNVE